MPQCRTAVDAVDAAAGHRAANQCGINQFGDLIVGRVAGSTGHLQRAVHPGDRLAAGDLRNGECVRHGSIATAPSCFTTVDLSSSTLKPLSDNGVAPSAASSAARRNTSAAGGWP